MSDEFDVGDFQEPTIPLSVWIETSESRLYGEKVAEKVAPLAAKYGEAAGKKLHQDLVTLARNISNIYGKRLLDATTKALRDNLPSNVDASELDDEDADDMEIWGDDFFESIFDVQHAFLETIKPYIYTSIQVIADSRDYAMPGTVSDDIKDSIEQYDYVNRQALGNLNTLH